MTKDILKRLPKCPDRTQGWRIRSSATVYDSLWLRVGEYEAIAPTGANATYGLVSFKNLAIGVLPIFEDGTTVLVGQHRFAFGQYSWEVPEGGGKIDVPPVETAMRELSEEVQLKAENWYTLFENLHMSNSVTDERAFGFIAWDLSPSYEHEADDVEDLKSIRVPIGKLVEFVVNGEITDALTLAIVLKADHLWRTGQLPDALMKAFDKGQI